MYRDPLAGPTEIAAGKQEYGTLLCTAGVMLIIK